jgi:hypothetical protein
VIAGRALQSRAEITAVIFASYIKFILNLVLDKGLKKVINIYRSHESEKSKLLCNNSKMYSQYFCLEKESLLEASIRQRKKHLKPKRSKGEGSRFQQTRC